MAKSKSFITQGENYASLMEKDLQVLSPKYQELFDMVGNVNTIPCKDWTAKHSLAYLMYKFKQKFQNDFVLSLDEPISKSFEYKSISKIAAMLGAHACEHEKVKDYIDWFIDTYKGKRAFRSIGALNKVECIVEYKDTVNKKQILTKTTPLPEECKLIMVGFDNYSYITTFGDLLFLKLSFDSDQNNIELQKLFKMLSTIIDLGTLNNIT